MESDEKLFGIFSISLIFLIAFVGVVGIIQDASVKRACIEKTGNPECNLTFEK